MKTKNNVQKAITKSLAVIISLVLLSITVNAQNFWKTVLENNSFSQIAMAMVDVSETSPSSTDATTTNDMDSYAEYFLVESEEAMDVENWMTNETLFDGTAAYFEVETEEALEMEEWMTDNNYFVQTVEIEEATETSLEMEDWMTDNTIWEN